MASTGCSPSGSMTSYWIKFFKDSGIPVGEAANYAITFSDNRISQDMLLDLTKEYLNDMGITVLGDVIAILKHAKAVHEEETAKARAIRAATLSTPLSSPRRSTAASRTVNHYLGKDPDAKPMNEPIKTGPKMSKELAARLGPTPDRPAAKSASTMIRLTTQQKQEEPSPKVRRVLPEHEGRYKIIMPQGTTDRSRKALQAQGLGVTRSAKKKKSSVFGRLGADTKGGGDCSGAKVTITGLDKVIIRNTATTEESPSVFKRLGTATKRPATSTSTDPDVEQLGTTDPLEYAGVLKATKMENRKKRLLLAKRKMAVAAAKKKTLEQRLGPQKAEATTTTAGILSPNACLEKTSVRSRLGKTIVTAATSTTTVSSTTGTPSRTPVGVRARLGHQLKEATPAADQGRKKASKTASSSSGDGVFGRLGKQW